MSQKNYDLIIIGGGSGGFAAAIKANELGAKTLFVNKGLPLGGTCVNVGCVPSKTLLWAGEVMHLAKNHSIPGIEIEVKNFNFQKVIQDELELVSKLRAEKYEKVLNWLENATHLEGKAIFKSPNEIEVNGQTFSGEKIIITTGSTTIVPPIQGINETGYITHIEALKLNKQPKELLIIGAGPLGLEFAQMYSRFGTKVTILQRNISIFPSAERELTSKLSEILTKEGITIRTNVQVKHARKEGNKKIVAYSIDNNEVQVSADEILLATGKTPNTKELNLNKIGVRLNEKYAIEVNSYFQTSQSNIYAVGDVNNLPVRGEPTAAREGTLAAENALENKSNSIDYETVPWTIFTDPQLTGIGLTEEKLMEQIGKCLCKTVSFTDIQKAIIIRRTEGLIKMVIHPDTEQILGVHILAPNAGDLIAQAMVLIKNKNTIDDVVHSVPIFPTLSEAIKIAAISFKQDISKLSCCI